jgi:sirohydrochlorin ferrochelatase
MKALVVFAHGSSIESANESVRVVARELAAATGALVEPAFLEGGTPTLAGAVAECVAKGASQVVVLPYFLTLGLHLQRDLPRLMESIRREHPGIDLSVAPPLDGHPALIEILKDRA